MSRSCWCALPLVALVLFGDAARASAQRPVIRPGREAEVTALFAPLELGGEVSPGWTMHAIRIDRSRIIVELRGVEATARVILHHPEHGPEGALPAPSFVVSEEGGPESADARAAVIRALRGSDRGVFWRNPAFEGGAEVSPPLGIETPAWWAERATPTVPLALALGALVIALAGLFALRRRGGDQRSSNRRSASESSEATSDKHGGNTSSD